MKPCHVYINDPDHDFDQGLAAEAARVADQSTRMGFPMTAVVRYARGNASTQRRQIQEDLRAEAHPNLIVVILIDQAEMYDVLCEVVGTRGDTTCVFLHQPFTGAIAGERERYKSRLFTVSADQLEIGRLQARQYRALVPDQRGDIFYIQGRENSYATRHRTMGLLEELKRAPEIKLNGYRVYGDWSGGSVKGAVEKWTSAGGRWDWIDVAGAQSDTMAIALSDMLREAGHRTPVIGVDGLTLGRQAVDAGRLAATVIQPLGVGHAMEVFRGLSMGTLRPDSLPETGDIVLLPESYPPLGTLKPGTRATTGR